MPPAKATPSGCDTGCGGAYSNPLDRDPQAVLTDLADGHISPDYARHDYRWFSGITLRTDPLGRVLRMTLHHVELPTIPTFAYCTYLQLPFGQRNAGVILSRVFSRLSEYTAPSLQGTKGFETPQSVPKDN